MPEKSRVCNPIHCKKVTYYPNAKGQRCGNEYLARASEMAGAYV